MFALLMFAIYYCQMQNTVFDRLLGLVKHDHSRDI